ncbi:MAG: S-layer homology domain-containing protein [Bryobacterales bacterium]|nr:S-layer homology domain-containing protein [Bryobacterales bacterium]
MPVPQAPRAFQLPLLVLLPLLTQPLCRGLLMAQSTAGSTSITGSLDPLRPPPPKPPQPQRFNPGHSVRPFDEYLRRKEAALQRAPVRIGPPGLETVDWTAIGRSPSAILRQPVALTPSRSFEGIQQTEYVPPDPDIAAGPEDLILVVNTQIARFDKSGQKTSQLSARQWFDSVFPHLCPSGNEPYCDFLDPTIRYDQFHGRFVFVIAARDRWAGKESFAVSVSNGATFASGWRHWILDAGLNGTVQTNFRLDYPQFGYDHDAVYLTGNMFDAFDTFRYAKLRILKKTELYNPATTALNYRELIDLRNEDGTRVETLIAASTRGLVGQSTAILVNSSVEPNVDYLTLWRIQNPTGDNPVPVRTTIRGIWRYDMPADPPQRGSLLRMDTGDGRILKAVVRNGVLFVTRNTGYAIEPTTVTYDRIDLRANRVTLQARHTGGSFFSPSFDVPATLGPGNSLPGKLITGAVTDANGAVGYLGIPEVKSGEAPWELLAKWGDYFGGAVDPVDGGLWTYGQFAKQRGQAGGAYGTWVAYFPWSTSPEFADVPSANLFYNHINVLRLWSISSGCSSTGYCPGDNVTRGQMAAFVIRSIAGDTFSFPEQPYFTDVPSTHPFFRFIQKMRELNITSGCGMTTYCPDASVTRGEMAVFVIRGKFRALFGDAFSIPSSPYFSDVPAAHPFFRFVQKLRELGITGGCSATAYCPNSAVTREQMAAFLVRAYLN